MEFSTDKCVGECMRGYQFGNPDAFASCPPPCTGTTDSNYVDGVSITHATSPRKHILTYAAGVTEGSFLGSSCPCTGIGDPPPAFVGSNYYCESGHDTGSLNGVLYTNNPLWDGQDCGGTEGTCCDPPKLPWFCKEPPQSTTDDLQF